MAVLLIGAAVGAVAAPATGSTDGSADPASSADALDSGAAPAQSADPSANGTATANVFTTGESVTFDLDGSGEVSYAVHDYWGQPEDSGTVAGGDRLTIPVEDPGYYQLTLRAGGVTTRESFAVVAPKERDPEESYFGMQGHFAKGYPLSLIPVIDRMGAEHVRDGHMWKVIESEKGVYEYDEKHTTFMQMFDEHGLEPLIGLWYGNTLYYEPAEELSGWSSHFTPPYDQAGREAYTNYARELVGHYPDLRSVEVWNEYNHAHFSKGPAGQDAVAYTETLEHTYDGVKRERSAVRVVGGAVAQAGVPPLEWTDRLAAEDAFAHMDTYSIHPYGISPEGEHTDRPPVDEEMAQYHSKIGDTPLWITESGTHTGKLGFAGGHGSYKGRSVDEVTQARYAVRRMTLAQAGGVERFFFYQLVSNGDKGSGLLDGKGEGYDAKPGYSSYATMARVLEGAEFRSVESHGPDFYDLAYDRDDGTSVRVMWNIHGDATRTLNVNGPVEVVTLMGERRTLKPQNGKVYLGVTADPVYVIGPVTGTESGAPVDVRGDVPATGGATTVTATTSAESLTPATISVRSTSTELTGGEATLTLPAGWRPSSSTIHATVAKDGNPFALLTTGADGSSVSAVLGKETVFDGLSAYTPGGGASAMVHDVVERGGRSCWQTNHSTDGSPHVFFDVDDRWAYDTDEPMTVAVRYYDEGTGTYGLRYDAGEGKSYTNPGNTIDLQDTRQWRTARFVLPDASFSNRISHWRDFRIQSGSDDPASELCIRSVTVTRGEDGSLTPVTVEGGPDAGRSTDGDTQSTPDADRTTRAGEEAGETPAEGPLSPLVAVLAIAVAIGVGVARRRA
jgi:hypothetical protein